MALLVLGPVLAVAALWVLAISPGPVLFRQQRVGLGGEPFAILKLRTMTIPAPDEERSTVSVRNDPRLIRGAPLIRKLKIDEIPQLLNVLLGDMSLVGPRPTVQEDYDKMTPRQRRRCETPPGMTGLAQVRGNTSLSWPQRIEFDLKYLARRSFWLDTRVLSRTAWLVLRGAAHTDPPSENEWEAAA
ncbi:putative sugar transferase EpsL [Pseudobythopirellula maris]|uniref:Putative sugar transferase EpsL n=2 Tax=Pseudobythopirellula maris TaxID=2527991 RepID=A0A5C5ZI61_9BACT|nr:putative sugar transferase EpsL [Pseudobythopirellula maris]